MSDEFIRPGITWKSIEDKAADMLRAHCRKLSEEANRHYSNIENSDPETPGAAVRAADADIERALRYLIGQGHTEGVKSYLVRKVDALSGEPNGIALSRAKWNRNDAHCAFCGKDTDNAVGSISFSQDTFDRALCGDCIELVHGARESQICED